MSEYIWAKGCRISKKTADPQVIGDTLDTLQRDNGGRITPRVVVDAARPDDSPLHPCFEWDDLKAAELFREDQARHVISSVRIVQRSEDPRQEARVLHAFVSLSETIDNEEQRAYVPLSRVLTESDLMQQAIERAAAELRAFEDRYREFDVIAKAVKQARERIEASVAA